VSGRLLDKIQFYTRIGRPKTADNSRDQRVERCRSGKTDAQLAELTTAGPPRFNFCLLGCVNGRPGVGQKRMPGFSQVDGPGFTTEQSRADFFFNLLDLLAERGLADPELLRRFCEVQLLGDRENIPQMS